jgi:CheY-like chemotaxis protein
MKSLSIWVVDDDHIYQNMLVSYLAVLGYVAKGFDSGEQCVTHLRENPDVVLLDHNLGEGMKGIDVLRKIRSDNQKTKVIYISAEEKISVVSDVYQNGSEEFITKDSASLLRLKIRLEKIEKIKILYDKKMRRKTAVFAATILIMLVVLVLTVTFFW